MVDKFNLKDLEKECLDFIESESYQKKRKGKKDSEDLAAEQNSEKEISIAKVAEYTKMHTIKIRNFDEIATLPKNKEQIRIITQQSFNMYTIILKILQQEKEIEELYLSSFNIKEIVSDTLFEMILSGQVKKLRLMISESIRFRMPKRITDLEKNMLVTNGDVIIKLNWNHSKITLVKTKMNHYVLEGSGNLSDNAQIEQYLFENNKEIYLFHKNWMDKTFLRNSYKREEIMLPGLR